MKSIKRTIPLVIVALAILIGIAWPVSAGLFEWSRLGRLIPQAGFEPSVSAIAAHPTTRTVLYSGTLRSTDNTNLVFKSSDGGATWGPASAGLPTNMPQNTGVNALLIRKDTPNTLYAGLYKAGVWLSANGGQSWADATNGSIAGNETVIALDASPGQPKLIYALTGTGMHRSSNSSPWEARSNGLPGANEAQFTDLAADALDPGTVYVGTNPDGLYRTVNDGQSWTPVNDSLPGGDLNVRGIVVSPVSGRMLVSIAGQGLWRSDDQGDSWVRSDNGITYNTTLQGNVGVPVFSPTDPDISYVYNNDGVFSSIDGGETWAAFNDGFTGAETVATMAFHPAAPNTVYAGTSVSGVWSLTVVPGGRYYVPMVTR